MYQFVYQGKSTMALEKNQEKLAQFEEFFSIEHPFNVNLSLIDIKNELSFDQFTKTIPLPFKMASDNVTLDQSALRPLQALSGVAGHLVDYLNHQAQKIDLLVGYILSQHDDETARYAGVEFGGGGIVVFSKQAFTLGQRLEMKLFFLEENCAVFCHGDIVEIAETSNGFDHKIVFHHIREEDREILVRTSLHQQSKQLQMLAKQRDAASREA